LKTLKIVAWIVLILVVTIAAGANYLRFGLPRVAAAPDTTIEVTPERLARGRYLVEHVMGCMSCHSPARHGDRYSLPPIVERKGAGGLFFTPENRFPGTLYAKNITPHNLGSWSDGEIVRALTVGVDREGEPIFPLMPSRFYAQLDRRDIYAVVAYLRTLKPVVNVVQKSQIDFPLNLIIRTEIEERDFGRRPELSDNLAYGRYMTTAAGCVDCHTNIVDGQALGEPFAGGREFYTPPVGLMRSANITPDKQTGIGDWSRQAFIERFKSMTPEAVMEMKVEPGEANTLMPWWEFSGMTRQDLGAIYDYLMTQKPVRAEIVTFEPIKK
jgi:hypothetical protein